MKLDASQKTAHEWFSSQKTAPLYTYKVLPFKETSALGNFSSSRTAAAYFPLRKTYPKMMPTKDICSPWGDAL